MERTQHARHTAFEPDKPEKRSVAPSMDWDGLAQRLKNLERAHLHLLHLRWTATVLAFVLAALWLHGQRPNRLRAQVAAREFVLKDDTGTVRGQLGLARDGSSELVLNDDHGSRRISLSGGRDRSATVQPYVDGDACIKLCQAACTIWRRGCVGSSALDQQEPSARRLTAWDAHSATANP
jgi:hypothetical protein